MTRYFAYGANMDPVHMASECPGARRIGRALLPDHRFEIAAGGFGTAVPVPGGVLRGVLWDLTDEDVAALDEFENVETGFYYKSILEVRTSSGETSHAMLYRASDRRPGRPAPGYLERIIEVAEAEEFPEDYLSELRALLAPR